MILICLICIPLVQANASRPPNSTIISSYVSTHNQIGIWWENPKDVDFAGTQIWWDNVYQTTVSNTTVFYYKEFLSLGAHTFSTHTIDIYSNVNGTWINLTVDNNGYFSCSEMTYNEGYCPYPAFPTADFTSNVTGGITPLPVQFTDNSTVLTPLTWNWSFGTGDYSNLQNPVYTYLNPGAYDVSLNVSNATGFDIIIKDDYIVATTTPPTANFDANVTSGVEPLVVQFNDLSSGAATWNWSFGDGTYSESSSPIHTYTYFGVFDVELTVTNAGGSDSETKLNYITVYEQMVADFNSNVTSGYDPLAVGFSSITPNATSWEWTFGGANMSYVENPQYEFNGIGYYTVTLNASTAYSFDIETKVNYINVTSAPISFPIADFTANVTNGDAPLPVQFTDLSVKDILTWNWSFGNGEFSNLQNPQYTYIFNGTYDVSLTVTNATGSDTETKLNYISVGTPPVPTPKPTPFPINESNITQGQLPTQIPGKYTDVFIWGIMFAGCLVCMVLSRDYLVQTMRPMIFSMMSFILAIASAWTSLSIAYMGTFMQGAKIVYTNQTNTAIYYYQIIQVVSAMWITILCVILIVFTVINIVDIVIRYIQKGENREREETMRWKI